MTGTKALVFLFGPGLEELIAGFTGPGGNTSAGGALSWLLEDVIRVVVGVVD